VEEAEGVAAHGRGAAADAVGLDVEAAGRAVGLVEVGVAGGKGGQGGLEFMVAVGHSVLLPPGWGLM